MTDTHPGTTAIGVTHGGAEPCSREHVDEQEDTNEETKEETTTE